MNPTLDSESASSSLETPVPVPDDPSAPEPADDTEAVDGPLLDPVASVDHPPLPSAVSAAAPPGPQPTASATPTTQCPPAPPLHHEPGTIVPVSHTRGRLARPRVPPRPANQFAESINRRSSAASLNPTVRAFSCPPTNTTSVGTLVASYRCARSSDSSMSTFTTR